MSHGTTLVTTPTSTVLVTQPAAHTAVVVAEQPQHVVVTRGIPGPRGPQGQPGPAGGAAFIRVAAVTLSALVVVWEDAAGLVRPLDYRDEAHIELLCGLTITSADAGQDVTVQRAGPLDAAGLWLAPGRVYLGAGGSLTQTPPNNGFDVLVGVAVSPTRLILSFQDPIQME